MANTGGDRTYYWAALPSRVNWSDPRNWIHEGRHDNGVPGQGDKAVLDGPSQQFAQVIHLDQDIEVGSLILNGNKDWDPRAELRSSDNTSFTLTITDEFMVSEVDIHLGAKIVAGEDCVVTIIEGIVDPRRPGRTPQGTNLGRPTEDPGFLTINGRGSMRGQLKIGTDSTLTVGAGGQFAFESGVLAGAGTVTINGFMLWESGTMGDGERETGTTVIGPGETAKGRIEIEIGGNRDSEFDRLITNSASTTGTSKLAGVVEVRLLNVVETVRLGLTSRRVNRGPTTFSQSSSTNHVTVNSQRSVVWS